MFAERIATLRSGTRRFDAGARAALVLLLAMYAAALLAPVIAPYAQSEQVDIVRMANHAPTLAHPFGTDRFSRDVLTRVLYGARVSLSIATIAVLVAAVVGTMYGLVAAAFGGVVDTLLMRLLDTMLAIPKVLLLVAVLALWSPMPLWALVLLLGLTGWFDVSRLVRAEALVVREREFVLAAHALGAGRRRVMFRHLLPNVLVPVIVTTTLGIGNVIVLEAGLSFIGIGVREPNASWGTMFYEASEAFAGTWWAALFPGVAIVTTVLCFNVLGDALRAALDPRQLPSASVGTRGAAATSIDVFPGAARNLHSDGGDPSRSLP
ncbi:MAG TPA: ABC transporter permease [Gemmatimonadaceae bacterium]|nr:ABC transporter permease [Gemmatimonadaceae bacterium]